MALNSYLSLMNEDRIVNFPKYYTPAGSYQPVAEPYWLGSGPAPYYPPATAASQPVTLTPSGAGTNPFLYTGGGAGSSLYDATITRPARRVGFLDEYGSDLAVRNLRGAGSRTAYDGYVSPPATATDQLENWTNQDFTSADKRFGVFDKELQTPTTPASLYDEISKARDLTNQQYAAAQGIFDRQSRALGLAPADATQTASRARRTSLARAIAEVDAMNRAGDTVREIDANRQATAFDLYGQDTGAAMQGMAQLAQGEAEKQNAANQLSAQKSASKKSMIGQAVGIGAGLLAAFF